MFISHHRLHEHHIYQLEVIFLFVFGFFLLIPYYLIIQEINLDLTIWQWYFVIPWMAFYCFYSLKQRGKIPNNERISPLKRPIGHWVLLGILLIAYHLQPIDYEQMYSIDIAFMIFSLFLADSYWDFEKLKLFS
jgi:hypothetical protein